jgi:hypothetical protein
MKINRQQFQALLRTEIEPMRKDLLETRIQECQRRVQALEKADIDARIAKTEASMVAEGARLRSQINKCDRQLATAEGLRSEMARS